MKVADLFPSGEAAWSVFPVQNLTWLSGRQSYSAGNVITPPLETRKLKSDILTPDLWLAPELILQTMIICDYMALWLLPPPGLSNVLTPARMFYHQSTCGMGINFLAQAVKVYVWALRALYFSLSFFFLAWFFIIWGAFNALFFPLHLSQIICRLPVVVFESAHLASQK